eukprot:4741163-Pyramimonas_sp.AAC.1
MTSSSEGADAAGDAASAPSLEDVMEAKNELSEEVSLKPVGKPMEELKLKDFKCAPVGEDTDDVKVTGSAIHELALENPRLYMGETKDDS